MLYCSINYITYIFTATIPPFSPVSRAAVLGVVYTTFYSICSPPQYRPSADCLPNTAADFQVPNMFYFCYI